MSSSYDDANNEYAKTPLENLKGILAKADERAAASLPPGAKAVFTIEGEEPQAAELSIPKSRLRSVLTAVEDFPQDKFSRQPLKVFPPGYNPF